MWPGILWFTLLTAGMLCYPRRPRTAGVLWIMLGALSLAMNVQRNDGAWFAQLPSLLMIGVRSDGSSFGQLPGLFMIGMGSWYLIKYRNPDVRAKHVEYWTAKA